MRWGWLITILSVPISAWSATITVKPLSEVVVYPERAATATTMSLNNSQLSAEINARIVDIPVLVGQRVEPGKVLLRLDCERHELILKHSKAALTALQARLEFAGYQYKRAKSLSTKGSVSEEVLIQRKTDLQAMQADEGGQKSVLRQAEMDVERCELRAPFDAVITTRFAQVGEQAQQGMPLLQLIDINNLEITAKVRGEDAESLESASMVSFESLGESYPVNLRIVSPVFDARERSRDARLHFEQKAALPGSAGEIKWHHDKPHVPPHLLVRRNETLGLFILNGEKALFEPLPQSSEGRPAEVNLPMNTIIILDGRHALQDGETVSH